jgi:hypothetical protein
MAGPVAAVFRPATAIAPNIRLRITLSLNKKSFQTDDTSSVMLVG